MACSILAAAALASSSFSLTCDTINKFVSEFMHALKAEPSHVSSLFIVMSSPYSSASHARTVGASLK